MNIFNTLKHLFSRSQAWRLVASPIKEYIKGYSYFPVTIRDFIDNIWNDIFPSKTMELEKWEQQFNLQPEGATQERIDNLIGRWRAQGGQGLDYLQDLIHDSGYPQVFLHEWWIPGSDPVEARNPNQYLGDVYSVYCLAPDSDCGSAFADCGGPSVEAKNMLVNKGPEVLSVGFATYCLSPDSDCGSSEAECGVIIGTGFIPLIYSIPQDEIQWRYIIYVGAEIFSEYAEVPAELQDEFERLLLGKLPYQQWIGPMINYI